MASIKDVRRDIRLSYRDAHAFYTEAFPPGFVGYGRTHYIKTAGETEISWNTASVRYDVREAYTGGTVLNDGEIEVKGDLLVKALFPDAPMFIFPRDGFFRQVAQEHSYEVDVRLGRQTIRKRNYWPKILQHYLRTGSFDIRDRNLREFARTASNLRHRNPINMEETYIKDAMAAADILREIFDGSADYRGIATLKSVKPYERAVPEKLEVESELMDVTFLRRGEQHKKFKVQRNITLEPKDLPSISIPCVVNSPYAEMRLSSADLRRTDRIPKKGVVQLQSNNFEAYLEDAEEASVSYVSGMLEALKYDPLVWVSAGLILGFPLEARFARPATILPFIVLSGFLLGSYRVYKAYREAEKSVKGGGAMKLWLKGREYYPKAVKEE